MRLSTGLALGALMLSVAACDDSGSTAPGAVSEGEARALDEAAEMLDERRLPEGVTPDLEAPDNSGVAPEAAPEDGPESGSQ